MMTQCQHTTEDSVVWLPRWAWGADTELPRLGRVVQTSERRQIVVHHTVVVDSDATINTWETMDEITANMRRLQTIRWTPGEPGNLGPDVPYNLVVYLMPEGIVVCEGRGWDRSGAHTRGYNVSAIGIAFAGNFENQAPPLVGPLETFAGWLRPTLWDLGLFEAGGYPPMEVLGHRDTKATACPGQKLYEQLHHLVGGAS